MKKNSVKEIVNLINLSFWGKKINWMLKKIANFVKRVWANNEWSIVHLEGGGGGNVNFINQLIEGEEKKKSNSDLVIWLSKNYLKFCQSMSGGKKSLNLSITR